jgi:hypothetical protein
VGQFFSGLPFADEILLLYFVIVKKKLLQSTVKLLAQCSIFPRFKPLRFKKSELEKEILEIGQF